jgi:hemoglobin
MLTSSLRRYRWLPVAAVFALSACAQHAATTMTDSKTLYSRLGGQAAIKLVVDDFVANVAADKRINRFFANTDVPQLKQYLADQICAGTGGPCTYTGRDMKSLHANMGITNHHFDALVEDLVVSLNKYNVSQREQKELLGLLGPMRKDIVTR